MAIKIWDKLSSIMAQFEDNKMEYADDDDDSYDMVSWKEFFIIPTDSDKEDSSDEIKSRKNESWKEFCLSSIDSDKEDSSAESKSQKNELESEASSSDDETDMFDRVLAYGKVNPTLFEFPAHVKRKDTEIKDVVKNHVLPFLPAKSLIRFRTISKDWDKWISSPFLAHAQSYSFQKVSGFFCQPGDCTPTFITLDQHAYGIPSTSLEFLPEPTVIRSSCNGLLLCQGHDGENVYYICNPVNKEWRVLPRPNYYHQSEPAIVLAFEPWELNIAAHFELICAFPLIDVPIVYFEIYSSEKRSWRCSTASCIELGELTTLKGGFYMKGMVYWETSSGNVLAFDMKNEICGILPLPCVSGEGGVLAQRQGELCYVQARYQKGNDYAIAIYAGMEMSLKHNIAVKIERDQGGLTHHQCRALACVNDDVVMILVGMVVYSYHLREQKVEVISRRQDFGGRYLPYVNSLVLLAPEY
ncbi:F-box protein At5g07610-like isoform X2 [Camellia sinensis]|uniref:F-box protein At5g07610-like isoform X2 n=2 Tax=Camellia sinensis TaxID=4442 RepID=UPI001036D877|nr:F-box protein At5g07610-like isoform X2 [Camellia sinensis]